MSEKSYISIRNGAIASVIAGVILLAIPTLREYAAGFLRWIWMAVVWCWEALVSSYLLPGWACLLIFILALVGLVNIFLAVRGESKNTEYKSYVEDTIHKAKWRWSWVNNTISNLWCYCPRCDATLVYDDSSCHSLYSAVRETDFICENCSHSTIATIAGGDKEYATGAIRREIYRRMRTGEYMKN